MFCGPRDLRSALHVRHNRLQARTGANFLRVSRTRIILTKSPAAVPLLFAWAKNPRYFGSRSVSVAYQGPSGVLRSCRPIIDPGIRPGVYIINACAATKQVSVPASGQLRSGCSSDVTRYGFNRNSAPPTAGTLYFALYSRPLRNALSRAPRPASPIITPR